jgi:integrase
MSVSTSKQRFKVLEFTNPRTFSKSWRVTGTKRDGTRIRENFPDEHSAKCRHVDLEAEFLQRETETTLRATKLTEKQLHLAELAFARLPDDDDMPNAIEHWIRKGKQTAIAAESPRIDDAVTKFKEWLDGEGDGSGNGHCTLREHSRHGLRGRVEVFGNSIGNVRVNEISPETVEGFLDKLRSREHNPVSAVTCDNYRRDISRFFSWCIERPRRWTLVNPCKEIRIARDERKPPAVLTVKQCKALLMEAAKVKLAPYAAVCLFGGVRPFEASRLDWSAVNLKDREIRLEGNQTKTGRARVIAICDTLAEWLEAYKGQPFFPAGWHKQFRKVKAKAKLKVWTVDVMRHTAISHYFRNCGSYGQTAEQFGNSEAIIKNHYQGRVSSDETKKFFAILPKKRHK